MSTDPTAGHTPGQAPSATPPRDDDRSLGAIVGDIADDLSTMVRSELELAKAEVTQEVAKAGKAGGAFGGAAVCGWFALLFLSLFAMYLLDDAMETAWAALIVFGVWALAAAALALFGRAKARAIRNPIDPTRKNLKEDVQWATNRSS